MKPHHTKPKATRSLAKLDAECKALGITRQAIADEAAKTARFGTMDVTTVSKVLRGRTPSANVVATARRLVEEARTRQAEGRLAS